MLGAWKNVKAKDKSDSTTLIPCQMTFFTTFFFFSFYVDYECYYEGSVYGYEYDKSSGTCTCKRGWFGKQCQGKT